MNGRSPWALPDLATGAGGMLGGRITETDGAGAPPVLVDAIVVGVEGRAWPGGPQNTTGWVRD